MNKKWNPTQEDNIRITKSIYQFIKEELSEN